VYRIAVNECVEVNRRSKSNDARIALSERGMDLFPDLNAKDGFHATSDREIREIIDRAVSELPEGMREAFDVFYKRQYSGAEAARLLNITEKAFYVRLSAARNRLRDELIKKGVVYVA
jgi:DNA-directed RNA polymerase specialized sigma24 family protein